MDEMMFNQSPYKPEITYDMHTDPPSPIMDKNILTKGHEYVWGWIKKNWLNDKGYEYEKGQGMSRRPDVVIVKDPNLPQPKIILSMSWKLNLVRIHLKNHREMLIQK